MEILILQPEMKLARIVLYQLGMQVDEGSHLLVNTANDMDGAIWQPAGQVTTLVHAIIGSDSAEGISDEARICLSRPVEITASKADAGDVELAQHPDWHRLQVLVQYIQLGVAGGRPHG